MFGSYLYDILFLGIPAVLFVLFCISLFRYVSAKRWNKKVPGAFSPEEIRKRKIVLIVFSVIEGVLAAIVIGLSALLFLAIAFM